jgi:hypothetical protein
MAAKQSFTWLTVSKVQASPFPTKTHMFYLLRTDLSFATCCFLDSCGDNLPVGPNRCPFILWDLMNYVNSFFNLKERKRKKKG